MRDKNEVEKMVRTVVEVSELIADDPDYESVWQPRLMELLRFVQQQKEEVA
jgi:hypothetical protein